MNDFNKNALVVQSNKLIEARYHLTVNEQRLIFTIASMIHIDDKEFYTYELPVSELAKLLDISLSNIYRDIDRITDQLMERFVQIKEDDGLLKVGWVSSCKYLPEKSSIRFRFDPELKPYLLQLRRDFTPARLSILSQFQSIYSIRMYQLLKQYRKVGYRIISVVDLKQMLGIGEEKYKLFKKFRVAVLNQAKKEFEKKSPTGSHLCDLTFDLETIREGKIITKLKFIIKQISYQERLPFDVLNDIDNDNNADLIKDMEYYGISRQRSKTYIISHGHELVRKILAHYIDQLKKGRVKNKGGGLLINFLDNKIFGKNQLQEDKEELETVKKIQNEKERQDAIDTENDLNNVREKIYNAMSDTEKIEIEEEFKKSVPKVLSDSIVENGVLSPLFRSMFLEYIESNVASAK
jgi:plasmid replication initiation protein